MSWFLLAFLSAIGSAAERTMIKETKKLKEETVLISRFLFAIPFVLFMVPIFGIPEIGPLFLPAILVATALDTSVFLLLIRAIDHTSMSRSIPLLAFSPAFLVFTSWAFLGELPTMIGLIGIIVIIIGAYLLKMRLHEVHHLEPFKRLVKEKYARYMLIIAVLMAVQAPIFKVAIVQSSPTFMMAFTFPIGLMYSLVYCAARRVRPSIPTDRKTISMLGLLGFSFFAAAIFINFALVVGIVPYAISVKRLSIFLNVIIGILLFREKHAAHSLIAGGIMVIGAIIIGFG